jgi:hypothetical protein
VESQETTITSSGYQETEMDSANERIGVPNPSPEHPELREGIKDENAGVVI